MDEKVYCSQCHLSVFRTAKCTGKKMHVADTHGHVLYCYKHKSYFPCNRTISGCKNVLPENRQKFLSGIWDSNRAAANFPR